ncbi:hypothetical protein LXA43DRAFT_394097 [Ganoderma leucocontextum]|nr:hypothetical protein LXA43DRAFT_394097 [Ganoderma leucocontextum]
MSMSVPDPSARREASRGPVSDFRTDSETSRPAEITTTTDLRRIHWRTAQQNYPTQCSRDNGTGFLGKGGVRVLVQSREDLQRSRLGEFMQRGLRMAAYLRWQNITWTRPRGPCSGRREEDPAARTSMWSGRTRDTMSGQLIPHGDERERAEFARGKLCAPPVLFFKTRGLVWETSSRRSRRHGTRAIRGRWRANRADFSAPRADTEDELCWGGCGLGADEIRALRAIARQLDAQVYVHSTAGSNDTLCQERDRRPRTQSYGAPPAREGVRGFEPRRPGTLLYHVQEKAPSSRGASTNGGSPGRLWPADEGLHSRAPPARKTRALAGHSRGTRTKTDSPRHHWHRSGHPWTPAGQKSS